MKKKENHNINTRVYIMFDTEIIKHIEGELEVKLPQPYRELLLSNSFANDPDPYNWDMFNHPNTIVKENRYCRNKGFFGAPWPLDYFIIGGDGFGNLYFLDLSRRDDVVFFADHDETSEDDGLSMYEETPCLAEWISQMREERAKSEAEEER